MVLFSALNSISDPVLFYLTSGVAAITALVILMLMQVIIFRIVGVYKKRIDDRARQLWRPVLAKLMVTYPDEVPELKRMHRHVFLTEWNRLYSLVRGEARARLQILAHHKQLNQIAYRYFESRNMRYKLQAVVTLGRMQDYSVWDRLVDLVHHEHTILSLSAAQALVDIDSKAAMQFLVRHIIKRRDWPVARVAMLLHSAKPAELSELLQRAFRIAKDDDIPHILQFLGSSHFDPALKQLCSKLGQNHDSRIIAACIDAANDADGLQLARRHADHPEWFIRLHVAHTLGRLGALEDIELLIKLMSDPEWWVRYRSAQSLARLPFVSVDYLQQLSHKLDDRYARDILQQVISEQQWSHA